MAEAIEREVTWLKEQPVALAEQATTAVPVDINAMRREIHKDFRQRKYKLVPMLRNIR